MSCNQMAFSEAKTGQYMLGDSPGDLIATKNIKKEESQTVLLLIPLLFLILLRIAES